MRKKNRMKERAAALLALAVFVLAAGIVGRHDYQEEVSKTRGISAAYIQR